MIDAKLKDAYHVATHGGMALVAEHFIKAYIQAEARARMWENRFTNADFDKILSDYVAEIEAELSK